MRAFLFILVIVGFCRSAPVFADEGPCAASAQKVFKAVTGSAPRQFGLSSTEFNAWADAQEYVYVAANSMSSAYVMQYFYLDGRSCFLNSMRYDGDM